MTFFVQKIFRILQRNFQACVEAAQRNLSPSDRVRHNEANGITPNVPDSRDLGYLVREMANTVQAYSFQMSQLSGQDLKSLNFKLLRARRSKYELVKHFQYHSLPLKIISILKRRTYS